MSAPPRRRRVVDALDAVLSVGGVPNADGPVQRQQAAAKAAEEQARKDARNARRRRRRAERPAGDTAPKPVPALAAPPAALRPFDPTDDPDTPDAAGLVWCSSCLRRVTPLVRALHRGGPGHSAAVVEHFEAQRQDQALAVQWLV